MKNISYLRLDKFSMKFILLFIICLSVPVTMAEYNYYINDNETVYGTLCESCYGAKTQLCLQFEYPYDETPSFHVTTYVNGQNASSFVIHNDGCYWIDNTECSKQNLTYMFTSNTYTGYSLDINPYSVWSCLFKISLIAMLIIGFFLIILTLSSFVIWYIWFKKLYKVFADEKSLQESPV